MPLVRSLANRYAGRGEPTDDLVEVGAIGLVKAIDRFELEKGVELSTYAVPTIVGEMPPLPKLNLGRPCAAPAQGALDAPLLDPARALGGAGALADRGGARRGGRGRRGRGDRRSRGVEGLFAPVARPAVRGGRASALPGLADEERGYAALERGSVVRQGLDALDERERRIVVLRFLRGMSQSEIAAEVGICRRTLEAAAQVARDDARATRRDGGDRVNGRVVLEVPAKPEFLLLARLAATSVDAPPERPRRRSPTSSWRSPRRSRTRSACIPGRKSGTRHRRAHRDCGAARDRSLRRGPGNQRRRHAGRPSRARRGRHGPLDHPRDRGRGRRRLGPGDTARAFASPAPSAGCVRKYGGVPIGRQTLRILSSSSRPDTFWHRGLPAS